MKKLISILAMVIGSVLAARSQGVIFFDGSNNTNTSPAAVSSGEVFLNGVLDTNSDINAELLYGVTPTNVSTPVVTLLLSSSATANGSGLGQISHASGDITDYGDGTFLDDSGQAYEIPNLPAGATAYFRVLAWTGPYHTLAAAQAAGALTGGTAVFSEVLTPVVGPYFATIDQMPALNLPSQFSGPYIVYGTNNLYVYAGSNLTLTAYGGGSPQQWTFNGTRAFKEIL